MLSSGFAKLRAYVGEMLRKVALYKSKDTVKKESYLSRAKNYSENCRILEATIEEKRFE